MIGAYSVVNTPENFHGGKIQYFLENWKKITSDLWTLQQVKGYKLDFSGVPQQDKMPRNLPFSSEEKYMCKKKKLIDFLTWAL